MLMVSLLQGVNKLAFIQITNNFGKIQHFVYAVKNYYQINTY